MMKPFLFCAVSLMAVAQPLPALAQPAEETRPMNETDEAHAILEALAEDYRTDPMAISDTFGIKLGEDWWTIAVERTEEAYNPEATPHLTFHRFGPHNVTLTRAAPAEPTWYFEIADIGVLRLIASGDVNAGTAAMQSFGSDQVGVETRTMDGFDMDSGVQSRYYIALSHFFTTGTHGTTEVTRFGRDNALETHGAQATALHMLKAVRILHFSIASGEVANDDERLEFSQVPNLFIVTHGRGTLETDEGIIALEPGMSVFVPHYAKHVVRSEGDVPLEGIVILYGDNSDFAFGTSFPEYLEAQAEFHGSYPFRRPQN
ncbi:MAG: cupin domain-containing protein [Parasphingopyxis sp.]|uniref:cupin domain-containing protein n=1 Tax=Parasphingopyxis sp. TaxID=1920299 RepID=UPI003FA148DB